MTTTSTSEEKMFRKPELTETKCNFGERVEFYANQKFTSYTKMI